MRRTSARLLAISPSATMAVGARAAALRASGAEVVDFGMGQPDFSTPEWIVDAAEAACGDPGNHRYTPAGGLGDLKGAVAAKTRRDSGLDYDPAQVLITNGAKHAVYTALSALVDPGDEVLIPSPHWTTYPEATRLVGGVPVTIDCDDSVGFKVSPAMLESARTDRTKVLIMVNPSNPTGVVYTPDEMRMIGEWALVNGIWVITDEIYEHLTYGDNEFSSLPALVPDLADRCLVINGVAKSYAMTGWRIGWLIGPIDVISAADAFLSHTTGNISNVSQRAAIAALRGDLDDVTAMCDAFERRGTLMHELLTAIPGITCVRPQGAFYCFPNVTGLLGRSYRGVVAETSAQLAECALDQAGVAFVPGEAFGVCGYARFSYATNDTAIEDGIGRLAAWASQ